MYRSKYTGPMFNYPLSYPVAHPESPNPYEFPSPPWREVRSNQPPPGSIFSRVDYENFRPRSEGYLDLTSPTKYSRRRTRRSGLPPSTSVMGCLSRRRSLPVKMHRDGPHVNASIPAGDEFTVMFRKSWLKPNHGSVGGGSTSSGNEQLPTWKTYLYQLQKEAPHPRRIISQREIPSKPHYYGKDYHGNISREETDRVMGEGDGAYLVRKSERAPDAFTLAIKFDGQTKNFKLYYDGQHYVGEKRFDTVHDLVADGLITFYLESRAPDYIESMSISNYAESPYLAYSTKKKRLQRSTTRSTNNQNKQSPENTLTENNTNDDQTSQDSDDIPANVQEYEKAHCFKVQNFIGLHWCDFCANFMWGLIAQGVKCQDCGFEAHKKCSERVPNDCMPDMKYVKRLFGADLTTVVKAQNTPIPVVVEKCIKEIESRGVEFEGMYRVAGFHDDIEMVRMAFDRDGENTDLSEDKWEDINILTSVLKLYFRLLPIPLVSFESYPKLLEAVQKPGLKEKEKLVLIKDALHLLQPAHYQTLKYLMAHLGRVVEQQSKNMMSSENLAIVFAPTLMRSPDATASLMAVKLEQTVTELIVSHQKDLFSR